MRLIFLESSRGSETRSDYDVSSSQGDLGSSKGGADSLVGDVYSAN
jgi:hypothetical protein